MQCRDPKDPSPSAFNRSSALKIFYTDLMEANSLHKLQRFVRGPSEFADDIGFRWGFRCAYLDGAKKTPPTRWHFLYSPCLEQRMAFPVRAHSPNSTLSGILVRYRIPHAQGRPICTSFSSNVPFDHFTQSPRIPRRRQTQSTFFRPSVVIPL